MNIKPCLALASLSLLLLGGCKDSSLSANNCIDLNGGCNVTTPPPSVVISSKINDTGIDWCANDNTNRNADATDKVQGCDDYSISHPMQDGHTGRDAQARAGTLVKIGAGHAGFDFTKLSAVDGTALAIQNAAWDDAGNEAAGTQWGCVRDNVTGLIWETKTNTAGLHNSSNTYTWFNDDATNNGGANGVANGGSCTGSDCDTKAYVSAVNALNSNSGLCGANDWRLPSKEELQSIVHKGTVNPAIDTTFFPNTQSNYYWSASAYAYVYNSDYAWIVYFNYGFESSSSKSYSRYARLVRAGQ